MYTEYTQPQLPFLALHSCDVLYLNNDDFAVRCLSLNVFGISLVTGRFTLRPNNRLFKVYRVQKKKNILYFHKQSLKQKFQNCVYSIFKISQYLILNFINQKLVKYKIYTRNWKKNSRKRFHKRKTKNVNFNKILILII